MIRLAPPQDVPEALALQEGLPVAEVEQRIGLAYAAAGLKHRVVAFYLQDLDARRLHQLGGCRTTAQYAAHRFGMSSRRRKELQQCLQSRGGLRAVSLEEANQRQPAVGLDLGREQLDLLLIGGGGFLQATHSRQSAAA